MKRLAVAVGLTLGFASCSSPVCGCTPIGNATWAVIEGTVVDSQAVAVVGAEVVPLAELRFNCSAATRRVDSDPSPAATDSSGEFAMTLWSGEVAGTHCVDFVVTAPGGAVADTVRDVAVRFWWDYLSPETRVLPITVSW